jgi:glycosyltransferase involved in cell wall biosynthesis
MQRVPQAAQRLRLVMVGDGPLRARAQALLAEAGVAQYAWLPGECDDVAGIMRGLDCSCCPPSPRGFPIRSSRRWPAGLPIVATAVGGNAELLDAVVVTGKLVPPADAQSMAQAIGDYADDPDLCRRHGAAARDAIERRFSMEAMVRAYMTVYDGVLAGRKQILHV